MKGRMPGAADEGAGAGRGFYADGQKNPRTFEEGRGEKEEPSAPHGAHGDLWERDTSVCKPTTNRRRRVLAEGKAFVGGPDKNFYEEEEGSKERGSGKGKGCVGRRMARAAGGSVWCRCVGQVLCRSVGQVLCRFADFRLLVAGSAEETAGGCSVGVPCGGRRGVEKTSFGKGREECFARDKMRRTGGLTRTLDSHKKWSVELALPVTEPLKRHRVHKNFNALPSGLGAPWIYGWGAPFSLPFL